MAAAFDGVNDKIVYADYAGIRPDTDDFVVLGWSDPGNSNRNGLMFSKRQNGGNFESWFMGISGDSGLGSDGQALVAGRRQSNSSKLSVISDNDVCDNLWHMYVANMDSLTSDTIELYQDENSLTLTETQTGTTPTVNNTDDLGIGDAYNGPLVPYDDSIAYATIWKGGLLTANQIAGMAHGINPFIIRSDIMTFYAPLDRNDSTSQNFNSVGGAGTITGTTKTQGPPVEHLENYI